MLNIRENCCGSESVYTSLSADSFVEGKDSLDVLIFFFFLRHFSLMFMYFNCCLCCF